MDEAFAKFAEKVVLFCHVTSRVEADKDQNLLDEKGGGGFPYLVFMDADGNVIVEHEGGRSVDAFTATSDAVVAYSNAKAAAGKGDKAAAVDVILCEMEFGKLGKDEGEAKLKGQKLSADQEKRRKQALYDLDVKELTDGTAAGRRFYEDLKAGKKPSKDALLEDFYTAIMNFGERAKKADVFEAGFKGQKELYDRIHAGNSKIKGWIDNREAVLKKLQGK